MEYVVVAYRSRSETVRFSDFLRRNGINNSIVNTPKEAGVGCGLSVKTARPLFSVIKKAVFSASLKSFAGFFLVTEINGKKTVRSI